jgi:hypothetical protein
MINYNTMGMYNSNVKITGLLLGSSTDVAAGV